MRIKSHWFKADAGRSAQDVAGATAFIAWRIAQNALKTMRAASYDLPPGPRYFAFVTEFLAFLVVGADRIAWRRGDEAWRVAFTTAMANRVGEILAENEADLLGARTPDEVKRQFIALVNERAEECATFDWNEDGPDHGLLRFLGHRVSDIMAEDDRSWAISQVIEVEAPDAAAHLRRGMAGLLDPSPRRRERGTHASGE